MSVLTLVKDRPGHLAQLVEGLRRSDCLPAELIVVDMGSKFMPRVENAPCPVTMIPIDRGDLPLAAARNLAAGAASAEHLLFLDVDCIPMRGLIGAMSRTLATQDALICGEPLYLGPEDARGTWDEDALRTRAARHHARHFPENGILVEPNPGLFWSLIFGIRRDRFAALGGFDEAFTGYGAEDTDFGFRADAAGIPLVFIGGTGGFHQHHPTYDPPLQHFDDILRNANAFHRKFQKWPMEGWLSAFERMGLITIDDRRLDILRHPTHAEIAACKVEEPSRAES